MCSSAAPARRAPFAFDDAMPRSRVLDEPDAVEVVSFLARSDGGTGTETVASAVAASEDRDDDDGRLGTLATGGTTTLPSSPSSER